MQFNSSTDSNKLFFVILPSVPIFLGGLLLLTQLPAHFATLAILLLLIGSSLLTGYYLWWLHNKVLHQEQQQYQQNHEGMDKLMSYTVRLEKLLLTAEPKIYEQVVAARTLTEQEIAILLRSFTNIRDELKLISDFDGKASGKKENAVAERFRQGLATIGTEIDVILASLQFQDRVSQILALVQDNLATLRATLEFIHHQGDERDQNMLQVEELLNKIESQYESVKHYALPSVAENSADELILF